MIEILRLESADAIAAEAARLAATALQKAQESHAVATFVLAGGRLPPVANKILSEQYSESFDWSKVLFLIGDERCVPLDDPESSWNSALPMFESHPEVPAEHLLRPQSDLPAEAAAEAYETVLQSLASNENNVPILNHLWLGIGEDGHTLSLFPNHPDATQTTDKLVIPVHDSPKPPPDRISLSCKALEGVQSAVVFISGSGKANILAEIANGNHTLPIVVASQTIEQAGGRVTWLVDDDALAQVPDIQALNI